MPKSLWTTPIDEITHDDVVAFCVQSNPESIGLEYKRRIESGEKAAKEIAALANTYGGILVFGVDEDKREDRYPETNPPGQELGNDPRGTIIDACHAHIYPPFQPEVSKFIKNPTDPKLGFVVVRVPPSNESPHALNDGRRVYVRVQDRSAPQSTKPETEEATVARISLMIESRSSGLEQQTTRRNTAIARLDRRLGQHAKLSISIGPSIAREPLLTLAQTSALLAEHCSRGAKCMSVPLGSYCIDSVTFEGWHLDTFGNLVYAKRLSSMKRQYFIPERDRGNEYRFGPFTDASKKDHIYGICPTEVVARIIALFETWQRVLQDSVLFSAATFAYRITRPFELPIIAHKEPTNWLEFGVFYNETDDLVDDEVDLFTGGDTDELLSNLSEIVLWSWGCSHEQLKGQKLVNIARRTGQSREI